jgi:predicted nuclease of predicted toxin-antitoxin system
MMYFLIDAQLPVTLARWMASKGFKADHVSDLSLEAASDTEIWNFANANMAIIVSKDEDFARRRRCLDRVRLLFGFGEEIRETGIC